METIGLVAALVALLLLVTAYQDRLRRTRSRVLEAIAARRSGWSCDGHVLEGRVGEATVTLSTSPAVYDQAWSIRVVPDVPWTSARVVPSESIDEDVERVRTGHAAFDAEVAIVGRASEVLPALDAAARGAIERAVHAGFHYDGHAWRFHNVQLTADPTLLQTALAVASGLAQHVRPVEDPDTVLEAGLLEEASPAVRAALLKARLQRGTPLSPELQRWLLEPRDWGSLLVARHLRDEAWLFELALHGNDEDTRWDAVGEVWDRDDPRLAAALGAFVEDTPWSEAAIDRLASVGTVAEVPVLRKVADTWMHPLRKKAEHAIRAIQARSRGTVGQLSLAEERAGVGAVSVAPPRRGRVLEGGG